MVTVAKDLGKAAAHPAASAIPSGRNSANGAWSKSDDDGSGSEGE